MMTALSNSYTDTPAQGGALGAASDILVRGTVGGVANIAADISGLANRAVGFIDRNLPGETGEVPFDDRNFGGDLLEGSMANRSDSTVATYGEMFVSEAVRFAGEEALTRGLLRPATLALGAKAGVQAGALKSTAVIDDLWKLIKGGEELTRTTRTLKIAETLTAYAGIAGLQAGQADEPNILGYSAKDGLVGYSVSSALEFAAYDTVFGAGFKAAGALAQKFAVPMIRESRIGKKLDQAADLHRSKVVTESMINMLSMTDDQIRAAQKDGRIADDIAEGLLNGKYDPTAPEYAASGPERSRFLSEMASAGVDAKVADAAVALHDAFGSLMVRLGNVQKAMDGKFVPSSLDDYYSKMSAQAGMPVGIEKKIASDGFVLFQSANQTATPKMKLPDKMVDPATEQANLKAWAGKSVVRDEQGNLIVMKHGTLAKQDFSEFKTKDSEAGAHFGTTEAANDRIKHLIDERMVYDGARVYPVYLRIENPLEIADLGTFSPNRVLGAIMETGKLPFREARELRTRVKEAYDQSYAFKLIHQFMKKHGFDGIKYKNTVEAPGSTSYIAFDPEQIKSVFNRGTYDITNPNIYYQQGDMPRGQVEFLEDSANLITLFKDADPSTVFHESAHIFRRYLPSLSADLSKSADLWVGAAPGGAWTREMEEKWAVAFERYLMDGFAPTKKLGSVFEAAKAWLLMTYKNVVNSPSGVELSPGIKDVFDQMLGGVRRPDTIEAAGKEVREAVAEAIAQGATATHTASGAVIVAFQQATKKAINLKHIKTTQGVLDTMKAQEKAILDAVEASKGDVQSYKEVVDLAERLDLEDTIRALQSADASTRNLAARMIAGKQVAVGLLEDAAELIRRHEALGKAGNYGTEYQTLTKQIKERLDDSTRISTFVAGLNREAGRAVSAGNIEINGRKGMRWENAKDVLKVWNGDDPLGRTLRVKIDGDGPVGRAGDNLDPVGGVAPDAGVGGVGGAGGAGVPGTGPADAVPPAGPAGGGTVGGGGAVPTPGAAVPPVAPGASIPGNYIGPIPAGQQALFNRVLQAVNAGQTVKILKLTAAAQKGATALEAISELWVASLLGAFRTTASNLIGGALNTTMHPLATAAGELVSWRNPLVSAAKSAEALTLYNHMALSMMDMWKASKINGNGFQGYRAIVKSLQHESSWFDRNVKGVFKPKFRARTFGLKNKSIGGRAVNAVGVAMRAPGLRVLSATDEFFKNVNYISKIRWDAAKEAKGLVASGQLSPLMVGDHIKKAVHAAFERGGAAVDQYGDAAFKEAYNYAEDAAYQTPLVWGLGARVEKLVRDYPPMRLILPFVSTPVNIYRQAARLSPLGSLQYLAERRYGQLSPEQLQRRKGEVLMGMAFWSGAIYLVTEGRITGGGPQSIEERKNLMATGWQPYSFVVAGADGKPTYISYARLEPIATVLGLTADYADIAGHVDDNELTEIGVMLAATLAKNATNKTFLSGISDFFDAMTDPDRNMTRFLRRMAASATVPAAVAQFATSGDDSIREAASYIEAVKRRVPGLSKDLPPRRNLLGEPITPPAGYVPFADVADPVHRTQAARMLSPLALSRKSDDEVIGELSALRHGLMQPPKRIEGLDLTGVRTESGQQAYDRWIQLTGEVRIGDIDAHTALKTLISSDVYKALPEPPTDEVGASDPNTNLRLKAVSRVLSKYREVARRQLIAETPQLREHLNTRLNERMESVSSTRATLERLKR